MRNKVFKLFDELKKNKKNSICFFRQKKRFEKTFCEFAGDVELALSKLNYLRNTKRINNIAIIGPISYDWIVVDMACIKGGFLSIAIPETLPEGKVKLILEETKVDVILMDLSLQDKYCNIESKVYHFECNNEKLETDFWKIQEFNIDNSLDNLILEEYSIVFSSGTSERIKHIKKTFPRLVKEKVTFIHQLKKIGQYISYKKSFWSHKDNKLIIFMPFSHPQQRSFFRMALFGKINIVLSDHKNCIKHIILEKPNIMVSVPLVYEAMADRIKTKICKFSLTKKILFKLFNIFRINSLSNNHGMKKIFSFFLFHDIKKIYGGRADYFVTGSAPISPEVIKLFYSIGVKLLQAYGQTETGNISISSHKNFKIGSVGKPIVDVKIDRDMEILVKYNTESHSANKNILAINNEEYIQTGDLGYLDKDGYLFITGRKDDIIVLENGKKIYPLNIEKYFRENGLIKDAFIFCNEGCKINVILDLNLKSSDLEIQKIIKKVNLQLLDYEKIRKYYIAQEPFSIENGMLTSTYKKKRNEIYKYYQNQEFGEVI